MIKTVVKTLAAFALAAATIAAQAGVLEPVKVANDIYALVGPLGQRDVANAGDNATFGAIVTPDGVILIDSGAGNAGAQLIANTLQTVTDKPVRWVINTGSQDHRWLGNAWFAARGAKIIALETTVKVEQANSEKELQSLKMQFGVNAEDFKPLTSPDPRPGNEARLTLGGVALELRHFGTGHFPGDAVVWIPSQRIAFSGDLVFVDRMLGVLDNGSRVDQWGRRSRPSAPPSSPRSSCRATASLAA